MKRQKYTGRIAAQFVLLSLIAAASGGALVLALRAPAAVQQRQADRSEYAGEWAPTARDDRGKLREIAAFVTHRYRQPDSKRRLADVTLRTPQIGHEPMGSVAVAHVATGETEQFAAAESAVFSLCGAQPDCSVSGGGDVVGTLAEREALETALRSFRAVDSLQLAAVEMPVQMPRLGRLIVFFRRSDLTRPLEHPLRTTLPLNPPPTGAYANAVEERALSTLVVNYAFNTGTKESEKAHAFVLVPASELQAAAAAGQTAGTPARER
jgi:hypothetical protein